MLRYIPTIIIFEFLNSTIMRDTKESKSKKNNYLGYIIFVVLILLYLNFSDAIWNSTDPTVRTNNRPNQETTIKLSSSSPEGNNCAVISTDKPYSYPVTVCRNEYNSESAWKAAIKRISKAKKYDEHGYSYDVTITYK